MSNAAERLRVELGSRSYDIFVGHGLLESAGEKLRGVCHARRVFIVSDTEVATHYLAKLADSLEQAGLKHETFPVQPGETSKSFRSLELLLESMLSKTPDRHTVVVALGGGVVGDLAGFAASILLRGVPFVQIPTTLLSQVDSSVGGKTGINSAHGKNLIGSFYQPKLVLIDTQILDSLPAREMKAGYAEVVKYGLLGDGAFFNWLEKNGHHVLAKDPEALSHAILTSCRAKAAIVSEDEKEAGKRALLNLGHTLGHALESLTGYSGVLLHGEAVAIGMVFAFLLSVELGYCKRDELGRIIAHLEDSGLPVAAHFPGIALHPAELLRRMQGDKKARDGVLTFILARGIGQAFIAENVAPPAVLNALKCFL